MQRLRRWVLFNVWYLGRPPWDTGISPPELLSFLQSHPPGRALDLGCGTGTNLLTLAQAGWQVTGVDFALQAVSRARRKLRLAGFAAEVLNSDVTDLPMLQVPFDLILDMGCYHGLPPGGRAAYRHQLHRLLRAGGTFLLYVHRLTPDAPDDAAGIMEKEIETLAAELRLINRQDSLDARSRPASWLTFTMD